jgi:hypothetical protein
MDPAFIHRFESLLSRYRSGTASSSSSPPPEPSFPDDADATSRCERRDPVTTWRVGLAPPRIFSRRRRDACDATVQTLVAALIIRRIIPTSMGR